MPKIVHHIDMTPVRNTCEYLNSFIRPVEQQPPPEEAVLATELFTEGVDDLFLQNMDNIVAVEDSIGEPMHAEVRLLIEAQDSSELEIIASKTRLDYSNSTYPLYGVSIREFDTNGADGRYIIYKITDPGALVIRREVVFDNGLITAPLPEEELRATLDNLQKNIELEIAVGLNNQPVYSDEMAALSELLFGATPLSEADWDLRKELRLESFIEKKRLEGGEQAPGSRLKRIARSVLGLLTRSKSE